MDKPKLYIKKEALDRLNEEKASKEAERLRKKIAAEEGKQVARRAQQEKQLAKRQEKKETLGRAKEAEKLVAARCVDLEAAIAVSKLRKERKARLQEARKQLRRAKKNVETAEAALNAVADANIELKRSRLREAFHEADHAWDKVNRNTMKKERDRSLKKQARKLLAE